MSKKYVCERGHEYREDEYQIYGGVCPEDGTPMVVVHEEALPVENSDSNVDVISFKQGEYGLAIFVFDLSGSMWDEIPTDTEKKWKKIEIVATAFGSMIADLLYGEKPLNAPDRLFIQLIGFSDIAVDIGKYKLSEMGKSDFENTFNYWKNFILDESRKMGGMTNITEALEKAKSIFNDAIAGNIANEPSFDGLKSQDIVIGSNIVNVPNIRVFIYSDGEHNVGEFINHFNDVELINVPGLTNGKVNGVMSMFIGMAGSPGDSQMEEIAGVCPIHNVKGKITMAKFTPEVYRSFRNLLHVTSNSSGFCVQCAQ